MLVEATVYFDLSMGKHSLGWAKTVAFVKCMLCNKKSMSLSKGVCGNNSCNADSETFTGSPIRAIGALGLGKLISTNNMSHLSSVMVSNGVIISEVVVYDSTKGSEYSDKAADTD